MSYPVESKETLVPPLEELAEGEKKNKQTMSYSVKLKIAAVRY